MVMGPDADRLLQTITVVFGVEGGAHFLDLNIGIMLSGPASAIVDSLGDLPHRNVDCNTEIARNEKVDNKVDLPNSSNSCSEIEYASVEALDNYVEEILNYDKCIDVQTESCLLYTSPSPRDKRQSRMPSSA